LSEDLVELFGMQRGGALLASGQEASRLLRYSAGAFSALPAVGPAPIQIEDLALVEDGLYAVGPSGVARFTSAEGWTLARYAELPGQLNSLRTIVRSEQGLFIGGGTCAYRAPILVRRQGQWVDDTPALAKANCVRLRAVGDSTVAAVAGEVLLERGAGGWARVEAPTPRVADFWGDAEGALVVVGDGAKVHHRQQGRWRTHKLFPQAEAFFVDGLAADDLFAVGRTRKEVYAAHFDGSAWRDLFTDLPFAFRLILGLVATGPGEALAFGSKGTCLRLTPAGAQPRSPPTKSMISCGRRIAAAPLEAGG